MNGKPTCRIYLFRHGETANAGQVCFNGHNDVDLSPHGQKQFDHIARAMNDIPLKKVYCSDLRRTRLCAEKVSRPHSLQPAACPELRELSFGEWEGLSVQEVQARFPHELEKRLKDIEGFFVTGGETFHQLQERVLPKFRTIVAEHPEGTLAMVCHGGVNRIILADILGIPLKKIFRIHQDYGAVNIIQFYGEDAVVEMIGGTHHHITGTIPPKKKLPIQ